MGTRRGASAMAELPIHHTSRDFETELRELRAQTMAMGARCERIVGLAFQAFWDGNSSFAGETFAIDAQIDRDEIDIHALVLRILALRQPVAADLRFIAAALRLITDLERVGDEAVNIAERALVGTESAKALVRGDLPAMSEEARSMLHTALQAFIDADATAAEQVLVRDDMVDRQCAAVIATMTEYIAAHSDDVGGGLGVLRTAKYVERIADHATNVAEEVIFMVRGDDVRHGRG